jgi:hypothetical protein
MFDDKYMFSDGWFYPPFFLACSPIKLKLEMLIDGGLLIANHLDQSLWLTDKKQWQAVGSYLLHSFLQVNRFATPLTIHCKLYNYAEPNRHISTFLHLILLCKLRYWTPLHIKGLIGGIIASRLLGNPLRKLHSK